MKYLKISGTLTFWPSPQPPSNFILPLEIGKPLFLSIVEFLTA